VEQTTSAFLFVPDCVLRSNDLQQKQDEHDGEDETESAATVVAHSRTHAVTAEACAEDQNDQNDDQKHGFSF